MLNIRGLSSATARTAADAPSAASAAAPDPAAAFAGAASPAVQLQVSSLGGAGAAEELADLQLLSELKARLESGEYRVDYQALARGMAEDWWLAAGGQVTAPGRDRS